MFRRSTAVTKDDIRKDPIDPEKLKAYWALSDDAKIQLLEGTIFFDVIAKLVCYENKNEVERFFDDQENIKKLCNAREKAVTSHNKTLRANVAPILYATIPKFLMAFFQDVKDSEPLYNIYANKLVFLESLKYKSFFLDWFKKDSFVFNLEKIKELFKDENEIDVLMDLVLGKPWLISSFPTKRIVQLLPIVKSKVSPQVFNEYRDEILKDIDKILSRKESVEEQDQLISLLLQKLSADNENNSNISNTEFYENFTLSDFSNIAVERIAMKQPFSALYKKLNQEKINVLSKEFKSAFAIGMLKRDDVKSEETSEFIRLLSWCELAPEFLLAHIPRFFNASEFFISFFEALSRESLKDIPADILHHLFAKGLQNVQLTMGIDVFRIIKIIFNIFVDSDGFYCDTYLSILKEKCKDFFKYQKYLGAFEIPIKPIQRVLNNKEESKEEKEKEIILLFFEPFVLANDEVTLNAFMTKNIFGMLQQGKFDEAKFKTYLEKYTSDNEGRKLFLMKTMHRLNMEATKEELINSLLPQLVDQHQYDLAIAYIQLCDVLTERAPDIDAVQKILTQKLDAMIKSGIDDGNINAALTLCDSILIKKVSNLDIKVAYARGLIQQPKPLYEQAITYIDNNVQEPEQKVLVLSFLQQWIIYSCSKVNPPYDDTNASYKEAIALAMHSNFLGEAAKTYLKGLVHQQFGDCANAYADFTSALEQLTREQHPDLHLKTTINIAIAELFLNQHLEFKFYEKTCQYKLEIKDMLSMPAAFSSGHAQQNLFNEKYTQDEIQGAIYAAEYVMYDDNFLNDEQVMTQEAYKIVEQTENIKARIYKILANVHMTEKMEFVSERELFAHMSVETMDKFILHYDRLRNQSLVSAARGVLIEVLLRSMKQEQTKSKEREERLLTVVAELQTGQKLADQKITELSQKQETLIQDMSKLMQQNALLLQIVSQIYDKQKDTQQQNENAPAKTLSIFFPPPT